MKLYLEKKLKIVLVGTGFYVCGKKKKEYGTILPAIFSFAKLNQINVKIIIAINKEKSKNHFLEKYESLKKLIDTKELVEYKFIFCEGSPKNFLNWDAAILELLIPWSNISKPQLFIILGRKCLNK